MNPRRHRAPSLAQLKLHCDIFNRLFPVGSPCLLRKDSGVVQTVVRHPAEVLGGHSAVAWFDGVSGAYSIENDRVQPVPAVEPCDAVA